MWWRTLLCLTLMHCGSAVNPPTPLAERLASTSTHAATVAVSPLEIVTLDVGQGDATLLVLPNRQTILIDGGPPGSAQHTIQPWLDEHQLAAPQLIITTHYDLDHLAGVTEWLAGPDGVAATADDRLPTLGCVDRGGRATAFHPERERYYQARTACQHIAAPGTQWHFGDLRIEVIAVNGQYRDGQRIAVAPDDENGQGIVLLVTYRHVRYLHTGDLPGGGGNPPYDTIDLESHLGTLVGDIDVLHVGHHGSHTASNADFLASSRPEIALISAGRDNDYGHPHRRTLERLQQSGAQIYATPTLGPIVLRTDGTQYEISTPALPSATDRGMRPP